MKSSNYGLAQAVGAHLAPILRQDGFQGSGLNFHRVANDVIALLQVQGSRYGGSFGINLGIHPLALPDVLGNAPDQKKLKVPSCEFRRRLSEHGADQWWAHDNSKAKLDESVQQAAQVYLTVGRTAFAEQTKPDCPLFTITPEEFDNWPNRLSGFSVTNIRMARALAILRRHSGNLEHSRAFARIALGRLGSASGLRHELEQLCQC